MTLESLVKKHAAEMTEFLSFTEEDAETFGKVRRMDAQVFSLLYTFMDAEEGFRECQDDPQSAEEMAVLCDAALAAILDWRHHRDELKTLLAHTIAVRKNVVAAVNILKAQELLEASKSKKAERKGAHDARLAEIAAIKERAQLRRTSIDDALETLSVQSAAVFATSKQTDGLRSNWGARVRPGKAPGN